MSLNSELKHEVQPDKTVTRAEFTVMLVKALQFEGEKRMLFADCGDHWAKDSIAAAIGHGLIYGYDAEHFGPDDLITREQAASIIARAATRVVTTEEIPFTDTNLISAWAKPGVAAAVRQIS